MSVGFPLYIDLEDNNCTIFGGDETAFEAACTLRRFGAKVTIINPTACEKLLQMEQDGEIRYLRRRYFRGDCSSARLCCAFTDDAAMNIAISDECKNKSVPVAVNKPAGFGTFQLPHAAIEQDTVIAVSGDSAPDCQQYITARLQSLLPLLLEEYEKAKK